jgi:hypothetical protein
MKLIFIASVIALTLQALSTSEACAQSPAISSGWDDFSGSNDQCHERARRVMQKHKFTKIETIQETTYGYSGNYHIAVRCVAEKGIYYVFAGGGMNEKPLINLVDKLKAEF